ncbi:Transcriptional regulatory protein [Bradyrhizobium sp. STM 3843]|uniref:LysR family transcriptional regulator n=1 Tax=Bradyrhizobium sp. STM 3843 TaxID=551947 RepID=UPI0002403764|nr:LysR family transcriptional regulator [Bradyrhizobium sp. STM 3843]CCE12053.1 Transcriptional regulatory protein [Bradyrhizobium sp. STM 3843]
MDRFASLTAFVGVVDTGGFSAAARRLNMSTTMVSNHVQALEDRLGVRLLNRTTRKVSLTEIGKAYYERSAQILAELEQADDIAGALQATPRGTLRVHSATHMVPFIAPVVTRLLSAHPDLKVELMMGETSVDLIDEGFDVALRMTTPSDSSLIVRNLATWRHVLCCSPGYADSYGRVQELAELSDRNCVRHVNYPFGDEWRFVHRDGHKASVRIAGNLVSNSGEALRRAALDGVGIVLAAGFLVSDDLEAGRLVRLLPHYRPVELSMIAVYPHRHHVSAKVRVFIDMLVQHSAEQQKLIDPYA